MKENIHVENQMKLKKQHWDAQLSSSNAAELGCSLSGMSIWMSF